MDELLSNWIDASITVFTCEKIWINTLLLNWVALTTYASAGFFVFNQSLSFCPNSLHLLTFGRQGCGVCDICSFLSLQFVFLLPLVFNIAHKLIGRKFLHLLLRKLASILTLTSLLCLILISKLVITKRILDSLIVLKVIIIIISIFISYVID